jgi:arylsulfatase A-like enzyme
MTLFRFFLSLSPALAFFPFLSRAQSPPPLPRRANIILIVADGLGIGDLSCYGQTMFQTPHLDQLAAQGVRFTNYSAGAAAASPARASLMLGEDAAPLPQRDVDTGVPLSPGDVTIAQILKSSGYYTGLIGEWNLGDEHSAGAPWLKGFDEFAGDFSPEDARNVYADSVWRYDPHRLHLNQPYVFNGPETIYQNAGGKKAAYLPDRFMGWAMTFAKSHAPAWYNDHQPFFLVLNETIPGNGNRAVPTDAPFSEEPWPQPEKNRAATIARLDDDIGSLLQGLEQIRQASNTVIFLTSDSVPKKGGGVDPKFFHENSGDTLRVPLIVHWPGKIPPGQVCGLPCSARDVLPTVTAIALVEPPAKIDGVSFLPALLGNFSK